MRIWVIFVVYAICNLLYANMMDLLSGMSLRQSYRSITSYFVTATVVEYLLTFFWGVLLLFSLTSYRPFKRKS